MYGKEAESPGSPIYGPSELSLFTEETILNSGGSHNMREIYQVKKNIAALIAPGY